MGQTFYCIICAPIWRLCKRNRTTILLIAVLLLLLRYRDQLRLEREPPRITDSALDPVIVLPCQYPDFVIRENTQFFDTNDPTSRARVGPNVQVQNSVNFTVIYNFASPRPLVRKIVTRKPDTSEEEEEEDEEDDYDDNPSDYQEVLNHDNLTLATHASVDFVVSHLPKLLTAYPNHPISLAIYSPGEDFCSAAGLISWFWNCHPEVPKRVSFHLFFPANLANDVASKTASQGKTMIFKVSQ